MLSFQKVNKVVWWRHPCRIPKLTNTNDRGAAPPPKQKSCNSYWRAIVLNRRSEITVAYLVLLLQAVARDHGAMFGVAGFAADRSGLGLGLKVKVRAVVRLVRCSRRRVAVVIPLIAYDGPHYLGHGYAEPINCLRWLDRWFVRLFVSRITRKYCLIFHEISERP